MYDSGSTYLAQTIQRCWNEPPCSGGGVSPLWMLHIAYSIYYSMFFPIHFAWIDHSDVRRTGEHDVSFCRGCLDIVQHIPSYTCMPSVTTFHNDQCLLQIRERGLWWMIFPWTKNSSLSSFVYTEAIQTSSALKHMALLIVIYSPDWTRLGLFSVQRDTPVVPRYMFWENVPVWLLNKINIA